MKWFLILWMVVNAIILAVSAYAHFDSDTADDRVGAAMIAMIGVASGVAWFLTLSVWMIMRA